MELSVRQAADQLSIGPVRVQQLLRSGRLRGRQVGRQWLVDPQSVALLAGRERPGGRPMAPARAWGLLDLLDGGEAAWLSQVARSQVRRIIRDLADEDADRWRSLLSVRSDVHVGWVHPGALKALAEPEGDVLAGGIDRAAEVGANVIAVESSVFEVYVRSEEAWRALVARVAIRVDAPSINLLARIPREVWPFSSHIGEAALAADLLESAEPRAKQAGLAMLQAKSATLPHRAGAARA